MEVTKEALDDHDILLNEESQNKCETGTNNKVPEIKVSMSEDSSLCTSDATDTKANGTCDTQRDDQNEDVDFGKAEVYIKGINEILNGESENIDDMAQLESTPVSLQPKNIHATINESGISGNSSSDEEILQTRFSIQNKIYEYNIPKASDSFVSISDKESTTENDSETKMTEAKVDSKRKSVDYKTSESNSEIELVEQNKDREVAIDISNHLSLSIEADNSNMDTESIYVQNPITANNELSKGNDECEILIQDIIDSALNEITFNENIEETDDVLKNFRIEDFFNGTLDTSIFTSEKKSPRIKSKKIVTEENQLEKNKYPPSKQQKRRRNVRKNSNYNKKRYSSNNYNKATPKKIDNGDNKLISNSTDDSEVRLKRKISRKQTDNSKKAKLTTGKNKDEVTDTTSKILNEHAFKSKTGSENKGSKTNSQHKQVDNQLKYNDKSMTTLNTFDMEEKSNKKSRLKNNTTRSKTQYKDKLFKDFSCKISPLKKSRDSRNCSLIALKKIKDIEKLENSGSFEEIYVDSDNERIVSSNKKNNYTGIFKGGKRSQTFEIEFNLEKDTSRKEDTISIDSLDSFLFSTKKEQNLKNNQITRSNRKRKNEFEDILDACHATTKWQLKDDDNISRNNFTSKSNNADFLVEENENMYDNFYSDRKKINNRRKSQNNEKSDEKLLKYRKNTDKITPHKNVTTNGSHGAVTRLKRKTWDMLEKELLGESNDASLSDKVRKPVLLKERSVRKQNMKNADIYSISDKSVNQTVNMSAKRKKYDGKYEIQNIESKFLKTPTNNAQSDSNTFIKKIQSNEIVSYKSKNILEKTIAAMNKCTAKFIEPKVNFTEKEWIHGELEFDSMINEEAEFRSNMTVMRNKNKQFYKNEIVAVLKQSNSKRKAKSAPRTVYDGREYKYGFSDAEHLIKKSIITESYSLKNDSEEKCHKIESQAVISTAGKKQIDPWTRLLEELNLTQNNEDTGKNILNSDPYRKPLIYHENLKQHTNTHPNTDVEIHETENEESELEALKQLSFEKNSILPNHMAACSDLNVEDNHHTNDAKSRGNNENAEMRNECTTEKMKKTTNNVIPKEKKTFQKKKVQKSPKFKLQVEKDGRMKFKQCVRSLSSSSDESVRHKQGSTKYDDKKFPEDKNTSERQNYKRYLRNLEDLLLKKNLRKDNRKAASMKEEKRPPKNLLTEQRKMVNILIAKDDDDIFSISSSDSETDNKKDPASGLLSDVFDE